MVNRSTLDSLAELLRQRERATIGGLELGELLGRGSFGRVYKGGFRSLSVRFMCSLQEKVLLSMLAAGLQRV